MICHQCGTEIPTGSNGCPACGFGSKVKLILSGKAGELSAAVDLEFGKTLGSKVIGDDSRFMDDTQFYLKVRDEKWYIKPFPRQKNPVFINGNQVTQEIELSDGDKLSLKDKAGFIDVKYI